MNAYMNSLPNLQTHSKCKYEKMSFQLKAQIIHEKHCKIGFLFFNIIICYFVLFCFIFFNLFMINISMSVLLSYPFSIILLFILFDFFWWQYFIQKKKRNKKNYVYYIHLYEWIAFQLVVHCTTINDTWNCKLKKKLNIFLFSFSGS